jgi:hypothetical protein
MEITNQVTVAGRHRKSNVQTKDIDPSRTQIEEFVRSKGYRLEKVGTYAIPDEFARLQQDLVRIETAIKLIESAEPRNLSHEVGLGDQVKRITLLQLSAMKLVIEQKNREFVRSTAT